MPGIGHVGIALTGKQMPKVTYVYPDGAGRTIDAVRGSSVMHAATSHGVRGIEAECGGACSCATCHVYVDEGWLGRMLPVVGDEDGMLDCTASKRRWNSRLSCQIRMEDELDGLIVHIPETQS